MLYAQQKVIPSIINHDQVGCIKGRYIGENIRIIFDLVKYSELNDIEAFLVQVDFEKAFDSKEWPSSLNVWNLFISVKISTNG